MTDDTSPEKLYAELTKTAQRLARTFVSKASASRGGSGRARARATTEVAERAAEAKAASEALAVDLIALASKATAHANGRRIELVRQLELLKAERSDVALRRRELDGAAKGWDWGIHHNDKRDFLGAFTIEHAPGWSTIALGKSRLCKLDYPAGTEVFAAAKAHRASLEDQVVGTFEDLRDRLLPLQPGPDSVVPWPKVAEALDTAELPFKKRETAVLFTLALLRLSRVPGGWSASFRPPTLAQGKQAVGLPRIDRPGSPERIFALRLNKPEA